MGLLTPDLDLSDFWRVRVLLQPTAGSPPSFVSALSLCLTNHFSCIRISSLPLSASDPCAAPFLSPASPRRQQTAALRLSFITPQYVNSDWSDLYVHKQVLGAIALHIVSPDTAAAACTPQSACSHQEEARQQAAAFRSLLQEEYPTVLVRRVISLLPCVGAADSVRDTSTPTAAAAATAGAAAAADTAGDPSTAGGDVRDDDEVVFLPQEVWGLLTGASERDLLLALEEPLLRFCASLLRQMGALALRTHERCRLLLTPLDGPLLSPSGSDPVGAGSSPLGMGRLAGGPSIPGVQTGAASLLRLLPSRLQKQTADLLLLGGAAAAAAQLYVTAAEAARAHGDTIWHAAAIEGQAAAVYAHVQHVLMGPPPFRGGAPRGTPGGPPAFRSGGGSRAELEETAAAASPLSEDREVSVHRSNSLPASTPEGPQEGPLATEPLPPPIEAILLQYQQRRTGAPPTGGPQGGPMGVTATDGSGGRGLPLLQPLGASGGPYGGAPGAYSLGEKETERAHAEQVQLALDAVIRKLRDACHAYQSHPGGFLLHASCSLLLCRILGTHGSKLECLQSVSSAAERAKRLEVSDFVCLLGALAGLCESVGAPRKVAFLLHRVCMALMDSKNWVAAHYAACLAAPSYQLADLQLAPVDQSHPLAYKNTRNRWGLGGPPALPEAAGAPQDAAGGTGGPKGDCQGLPGFKRLSLSALAGGAPGGANGGEGPFGGPSSAAGPAGSLESSETPYFPVYLRQRHPQLPSSNSSSSSSSSSRARGVFLNALWRVVQEFQAPGAPSDAQAGWGCCSLGGPSASFYGNFRGGPPVGASAGGWGPPASLLKEFLRKHVERVRFEGNAVQVAWPALQSRVLHVLKVSAEQLGDFSRVAWYALGSLKLLYPVIDLKAQASAIMAVQAAAGRGPSPLSLPPVLTILRPRTLAASPDRRGGPMKSPGGPPGVPKALSRWGGPRGSPRAKEDRITYLGGMCRGSVAPLPLLTRLLPLVDGGPPGIPLVPTRGEPVTCIQKRPQGPPHASGDGGPSLGGLLYPSGGADGESGPHAAQLSPGAPVGPPKGGGDVLMFNPFKKDQRLTGGAPPKPLEASGLWVRGELKAVQVSVRNPLSVELVLDKAKVLVCGAKAEVYPVTVLVPPSAAHQVTFEVTVMPRETGRLYFTGLSYTLNRIHCCQLLVRQSEKLDCLLSTQGGLAEEPRRGPVGAPGQEGPLQALEFRFKDTPAAAAEDLVAPPKNFAEAAGELLQYSAAACVDVVAELPLLRVDLEAAAPPSSVSDLLHCQACRSAALAAAAPPAAAQQQALINAPSDAREASEETANFRRRDTVWSATRSDSCLAAPYGGEGPSAAGGGPPGVRVGPPEEELAALRGDGESLGLETDSESDEVTAASARKFLSAFSFDAQRHSQDGVSAHLSAVASADPRHSPVWEGQHRLLSIHLENLGRLPVRDLSIKVLNSDASAPNPRQQAALEKHFQVLWPRGNAVSSFSRCGTVDFCPDVFPSEGAPWGPLSRGPPGGGPPCSSCSTEDSGLLGASLSLLSQDGVLLHSSSCEGPRSVSVSPLIPHLGGGPRVSISSLDPLPHPKNPGHACDSGGPPETDPEGPPLIQPGQKVQIPLKCIASEKYSACVLQITYSVSPSSAYQRQVYVPLSLRVQSGLQLRPQGVSIFPLSCFDPLAVLRILCLSGFCASSLVRELGLAGPSRGAPPDEEGPLGGPPDSESEEQGGGPRGGPSASPAVASVACRTQDAGGGPWGAPHPGTYGRVSRRGSLDSGGGPFGVSRGPFGSGWSGGPSSMAALGGAGGGPPPLKHEFDHKKCILCLDLSNAAPVYFECWALGEGSQGTQRLSVGPHDSQSRWGMWVRRIPLAPNADIESCLSALERHLKLRWSTFPSQQGSLCLFPLLEKAARAALQRRGALGGLATPGGGTPGAPRREESLRALGAVEGAPHATKQHSGDPVAAAAAGQQQEQQSDGEEPVPQHELMNLLQLTHLAAPKVLLHLRLVGKGVTPANVHTLQNYAGERSSSLLHQGPLGERPQRNCLHSGPSDCFVARVTETATLHVFVENRTEAPLEDCCVFLIPFSHSSEEIAEGLLWSGALTEDLSGPLLPFSVVRQQHRERSKLGAGPPGAPTAPHSGEGGPPGDASLIQKMEERGAVLCQRLSLVPCVPGVYHIAAAILCRPKHTVFWHHQPLRLVV